MKINKVVIPVAGWGTRSLPATKNLPKEILPVFKKPAIQYIVEEAIAAGLDNVIFITNKNKNILEDHFDYNLSLEWVLERSGKMELLREVRKVGELANIISIRQKRQLGLGHAILCAKEVIRDEAFAVILGDDLLFSSVPGIKQLIDVAETENMAVVGVMPVERSKVNRYGILNAEEIGPHIYRVRDLQEKPRVEEAASNLAVIGRYVLTPEIFYHLEKVFDPDQGGELELTEGLRRLAKENKLLAVRLHGMRFDVGHWVDYLIANIYFSLQDEELRDDVIKKLRELIPCS
ncbi:UTP--glucose-1-phosphate uridylyltransferase GalU [Desulfothermus okinawensis JCM 13304]